MDCAPGSCAGHFLAVRNEQLFTFLPHSCPQRAFITKALSWGPNPLIFRGTSTTASISGGWSMPRRRTPQRSAGASRRSRPQSAPGLRASTGLNICARALREKSLTSTPGFRALTGRRASGATQSAGAKRFLWSARPSGSTSTPSAAVRCFSPKPISRTWRLSPPTTRNSRRSGSRPIRFSPGANLLGLKEA